METIQVSIDGLMEYYSTTVKGNLAICNNMEEPQGHYAERSKSDGESQIPYDLSYQVESKNIF